MPKYVFNMYLTVEASTLDAAYAHIMQSIKGPEHETICVITDGEELSGEDVDQAILDWTDRQMANKDPAMLMGRLRASPKTAKKKRR